MHKTQIVLLTSLALLCSSLALGKEPAETAIRNRVKQYVAAFNIDGQGQVVSWL